MAQEVTTRLIDDLDGSDAAESVRFALDGVSYEIDLSARNAAALRKALDKYVGVARRSTTGARRAGPARRRGGAVDPREVRVWAEENGIAVSSRGRIPGEIVEQFKAATR